MLFACGRGITVYPTVLQPQKKNLCGWFRFVPPCPFKGLDTCLPCHSAEHRSWMSKFALWVGERSRVSFHVPIGIWNEKRSLEFLKTGRSSAKVNTQSTYWADFHVSSFSSGLYFPTTVTKLQEQTGLFVVGSCAAS